VYKTTARFWKYFSNLPEPIQALARKNFALLELDPKHPSLHFKRVGDFWSVRVGINYRALAIEDGNDLIWVWIGIHGEYERLIQQ